MRICHIIIWLNLNNGQYYHKFYKSLFFPTTKYQLGYINQYNHKIIDIVDIHEIYQRHKSLKRLLRKFISFLENILKRL